MAKFDYGKPLGVPMSATAKPKKTWGGPKLGAGDAGKKAAQAALITWWEDKHPGTKITPKMQQTPGFFDMIKKERDKTKKGP